MGLPSSIRLFSPGPTANLGTFPCHGPPRPGSPHLCRRSKTSTDEDDENCNGNPRDKTLRLATTHPTGIHDAVCLSKTYYGLCEGASNPPEYIPKLVKMHKDGQFPIEKISKVYDYTQFDEAVHAMHDGSVIKPIIKFK